VPAVTRKGGEQRAAERKALGRRLRLLRVGLDLTNMAVAASLDVRPATLTAWEKGTSELSALDALRLADLYRVDIAAVFGRKPGQIGGDVDETKGPGRT
jgi:DNA-binding XRE family transcriptional regulator